ncbi:MAG: hypothetical protein R2932_31695 [Caldilineaceae bacterium]
MNMDPEPTLVEFVLYNQWANQQLLSICMKLDEALLTKFQAHMGPFSTPFTTFSGRRPAFCNVSTEQVPNLPSTGMTILAWHSWQRLPIRWLRRF